MIVHKYLNYFIKKKMGEVEARGFATLSFGS